MINVLVVDDSPSVRKLLVNLLEEDPEVRVVGQAEDGRTAVELAQRLHPDVITMDVLMPDTDGIEATRQIMEKRPTPILIITAHADSPDLNLVFDAMQAGALEVMAKPAGLQEDAEDYGKDLVTKIKELSGVRVRPIEGKPER